MVSESVNFMRKERRFIKNAMRILQYRREGKTYDAFLCFRFHSKTRRRFGIRYMARRFGFSCNQTTLISFQSLCKKRPDQLRALILKFVRIQDAYVSFCGHGRNVALYLPPASKKESDIEQNVAFIEFTLKQAKIQFEIHVFFEKVKRATSTQSNGSKKTDLDIAGELSLLPEETQKEIVKLDPQFEKYLKREICENIKGKS